MKLNRDDITQRVKRIVGAELGVDQANVAEKDSFEILGADSMDKILLVLAFEEEFGCEITDEAADKINTIGDVIDHLEKNN